MLINAKIFVLLCLISLCMSEIQVFKNELSDEIKTLAIGTVQREILVLKHSDSVVAQTLSNDFSIVYGGKWLCFVGQKVFIEGVISQINAAPNSLLWFAYNTTNVLLFKSYQCATPSSYEDIISEALNFDITYEFTDFDNSTAEFILFTIKESLTELGTNCTTLAIRNHSNDNCYYLLSFRIYTKLTQKSFAFNWTFVVGKLNSASFISRNVQNIYTVVFNDIIDFTFISF